MKKVLNYINGELKESASGKFLDNYNPATGQVYSLVPDSNATDAEFAVQAAYQVFPAWSLLSYQDRAGYLNKLAKGIEARLDEFALAESIDSGKLLSLAKKTEIPRSVKNFQFFADYVSELKGKKFPSDTRTMNHIDYSPLGVVVCISPWNLPLHILTWKIAPALIAGNAVIAKPSEMTPMTAYLLSEVASEVLPAGVLNIIHGLGPNLGPTLINHPLVKAVSFTGSTATGRGIAQSVAGQFKKVSLEMGGKNPNIIFADCDFDQTLETTIRSSFQNQGQICLCGSRIFIQSEIYEKFTLALVERTKKIKIGNPLEEASQIGAVVSKTHMEKILSYIDLAKTEGGKILVGGRREILSGEQAGGYYIQPTLIEGLDTRCRTNQEEIFGPVATLIPFETEEQVIAMANSTKYGLSASVWSKDLEKAQRVAKKIEAGVVWINTWMDRDLRTPFGGVKESGLGREGGLHSLQFFSEIKNICITSDLEKSNEINL